MGWLIYNKKQWSPAGSETPRLFRAKNPDEAPTEYAEECAFRSNVITDSGGR